MGAACATIARHEALIPGALVLVLRIECLNDKVAVRRVDATRGDVFMKLKTLAAAGLFMMMTAAPAAAASCGNSGAGFDRWLGGFKKQAAASGIGRRALSALNGVTYSRQVIRLDRNQKSFRISQAAFIKGRVTSGRQPREEKAETACALCSHRSRKNMVCEGNHRCDLGHGD